MSKRVEVKREVKGQREKNIYIDNNNNSLLGLMQIIKIECKLWLPPQTNTNFLPTIKVNL